MARIYKRGKNWYMDYRYPPTRQGKRIREKIGAVTKDEAGVILATRVRDMIEGRNPEIRRTKPKPFPEMVKEFLERHAKQRKSYRSIQENTEILKRHFRNCTLQEITPKAIEDFIQARRDAGVTGATTNRQRTCLSKIFNCAIDWGYYRGENPVSRVKPFRETPCRFRFLEAGEAEALIGEAAAHLKPLIVCALHTGGRRGELLSLRWEDVDLSRRVLFFTATNTKSGKQRELPIDDELLAVLQEQRKRRFLGGAARDYVFTHRGKRLGSVRTAFNRARERAKLGEDVTFHSLRHTFASWFMQNGGDLFRLQHFLGHSTIELTQRYSHLSPEHRRDGVRFFGAPGRGRTVDTNGKIDDTTAPASA